MQQIVRLLIEVQLPTKEAHFRLRHYEECATGDTYLAMLLGD